MSEELREQIRNNLKLKDIYELLEIWRINNRAVWSDTTFEVLREILKEKIKEIPPQEDPIIEEEEAPRNATRKDGWEEKLVDNGEQPELYNPLDVILYIRNVNKLLIAAAIYYILSEWFTSQSYIDGVSLSVNNVINSLPNIFIATLGILIKIAFIYFPFKALSYILRILMEMEFNSRKAK